MRTPLIVFFVVFIWLVSYIHARKGVAVRTGSLLRLRDDTYHTYCVCYTTLLQVWYLAWMRHLLYNSVYTVCKHVPYNVKQIVHNNMVIVS